MSKSAAVQPPIEYQDKVIVSAVDENMPSKSYISDPFASWQDEDRNRHYPQGVWRNSTDVVPVVIRDGCNGVMRGVRAMTHAEAIQSGKPPESCRGE